MLKFSGSAILLKIKIHIRIQNQPSFNVRFNFALFINYFCWKVKQSLNNSKLFWRSVKNPFDDDFKWKRHEIVFLMSGCVSDLVFDLNLSRTLSQTQTKWIRPIRVRRTHSKEIMRNSNFSHSDWIVYQNFSIISFLSILAKKKSQELIPASCELINSDKNKFSLEQKSN